MDRMTELIHLLNNASKAYYQQNPDGTIMSDYTYDALYDELVALEAETGTVYPFSPTQQVGYTVLSSLQKVPHPHKLLSLDKTKSVEALAAFLGPQKGLLSFKLDGLTIALTYEQGQLVQAVTRGNGEVGEDVTHSAKVFGNVPVKIPFAGRLLIRGEAVITFADFEKINEALPPEEQYKNPRNLCSGTVRQLNSAVTAQRNVQFFAFGIFEAEGQDFRDSKENQLVWLESLGFSVADYKAVTQETVADTVALFLKKAPLAPFATDGLVLTFDSLSYSATLGETSKFPKDAIAFKWADETAETTLTDIVWNTSRTGLINPIAVFEPVELSGSTVTKASLHNVSIMEGLALGIGDTISVYKANMIIPQVAENFTKSGTATPPAHCPVCGFDTDIVASGEGKMLYCQNSGCRAQLVRALSHFVSRDAMDIRGLSEATLEKLVDKGFVEDYTDLYKLERYKDDLTTMPGFGEKSYNNLIAAIENSRRAALPNVIYALGISHVGLRNARLLCRAFDHNIEAILSAGTEDFEAIEGFGAIIAQSLWHYLNHPENKERLLSLLQLLQVEKVEESQDRSLEGKIFVITGSLNHFENRKELQQVIENMGGKVTGSVTAKTSYLINNDTTSTSSKNKSAQALNVPVITEDEFIQTFGKGEN